MCLLAGGYVQSGHLLILEKVYLHARSEDSYEKIARCKRIVKFGDLEADVEELNVVFMRTGFLIPKLFWSYLTLVPYS